MLSALGPASGYSLSKRFDATLGHVWNAKHSQIYPELKRLQAEGLIEVTDEGARGSKSYTITHTGRATVSHWVIDTEPAPVRRNEAALRAFLIPLVSQDDARAVLQREADFSTQRIQELEALRSTAEHAPGHFGALALELGIRQMHTIRDWAQWAIEQLDQDTNAQAAHRSHSPQH
ncbi:PadR family transcriptional regulator [Streptomyces sp. KR80]|uniref:PadR family transcriptional regulator n=1 Tax=Streptomyces sp. KR80 TaxID=3457426 RepID=UPI003FD4FE07